MGRSLLLLAILAAVAPTLPSWPVKRRRGNRAVRHSLFNATRGRLGGGVAWWLEPPARDLGIVTASPLRIDDITPSPKGVHIPKPQNGHITVGIRYRF